MVSAETSYSASLEEMAENNPELINMYMTYLAALDKGNDYRNGKIISLVAVIFPHKEDSVDYFYVNVACKGREAEEWNEKIYTR